jgi:riboflavin biosynthesis pyrimidine reductase
MRPHITCLMISSLDGSLATGHWTSGPTNGRAMWNAAYAAMHDRLGANAWLVGRVTMAEMIKGTPQPSSAKNGAERPHHFATRTAPNYAIALDPSGRLNFNGPTIDGDNAVVLLGADVSDRHLSELTDAGVSYVVSDTAAVDLAAVLTVLKRELGIERLLLEGGGGINGSFLAAGLVDDISLIVAPAVDGRTGKRTIFEAGEQGLAGKVELELSGCERLEGGMVHLRYVVKSSTK